MTTTAQISPESLAQLSFSEFSEWLERQDEATQEKFAGTFMVPTFDEFVTTFELLPHSEDTVLGYSTKLFSNSHDSTQGLTAEFSAKVDGFFKAVHVSDSIKEAHEFGANLFNYFSTLGVDEVDLINILKSLRTPEEAKQFKMVVESHRLAQGFSIEDLLTREFEGKMLGHVLGLWRRVQLGSDYYLGRAYSLVKDELNSEQSEAEFANSRKVMVEILAKSSDLNLKSFTKFTVAQLNSMPFMVLAGVCASLNVINEVVYIEKYVQATSGKSLSNVGYLEGLRMAVDGFKKAYDDFLNRVDEGVDYVSSLTRLNMFMAQVMSESETVKIQEDEQIRFGLQTSNAVLEASLVALGASVTIITAGQAVPAYGLLWGLVIATGAGTGVQTTGGLGLDYLRGDAISVTQRGQESLINSGLTAATMGMGVGTNVLASRMVQRGIVGQGTAKVIAAVGVAEVSSTMHKVVREYRLPTAEEVFIYGGLGALGAQLSSRSKILEVGKEYIRENVEGNLETLSNNGTISTGDMLANAAGAVAEMAGSVGIAKNPYVEHRVNDQEIRFRMGDNIELFADGEMMNGTLTEATTLNVGGKDIEFAAGTMVLYNNLGYICQGVLAEETEFTVGGRQVTFEARSKVEFSFESKVTGVLLARDAELSVGEGKKVKFPAGSKVEFSFESEVAGVLLAKGAELSVGGQQVNFLGLAKVFFNINGTVSQGILAKDAELSVGGQQVNLAAGSEVKFSFDGTVRQVKLQHATTFRVGDKNLTFAAGKIIQFYNNGNVEYSTLAEATTLNVGGKDIEFAAYTKVSFSGIDGLYKE